MKVKKIVIENKIVASKEGLCYMNCNVIGNIEDLKKLQTIIINFVNGVE